MHSDGNARPFQEPPRPIPFHSSDKVPNGALELNGRKILIVDDDRPTLFAVRSALAPLGYRFYEASDGSQALSALRQRPA